MRVVSLMAGLGLAVLAACSPADETVTVIDQSVTDAFVIVPPPGRDVTMGGLTLTVSGGPVWVTAARSDVSDSVELHTMSMEDGVMRMRQADRLEARPDTPLVLERGGAHLMFFGTSDELEPGDTATIFLTLTYEDGEEMTVSTEAEVRAMGE